MLPSIVTLNEYTQLIHGRNVEAGWWTDLATGQRLNRNFGEMLALVHSELSEGYEGWVFRIPDNHLPEFPMLHVEIADACIRVFDMLGGLFSEVELEECDISLDIFREGFRPTTFVFINLHSLLSTALEHYRKSRFGQTKGVFHLFLNACFAWADEMGFDLRTVIDAKLEYNRSRADHQIVNRLKSDGKKI